MIGESVEIELCCDNFSVSDGECGWSVTISDKSDLFLFSESLELAIRSSSTLVTASSDPLVIRGQEEVGAWLSLPVIIRSYNIGVCCGIRYKISPSLEHNR